MASILDQKQEVLKIELTKHGKKLLGMGLFHPEYFSFFDDAVIYDQNYANIHNEEINNIEERILNKTLTFSSINNISDVLSNKLGSSDSLNDYAPAWSMKVLNGKVQYNLSQSNYYKKIFSIEDGNQCNLSFDPTTKETLINNEYFLLDLSELNISDDMYNFEIELIAKDDITGLERKLFFQNVNKNVIDEILYEESELPFRFSEVETTTNDVSYYFDLLVDDEIDTEYIITAEKTITEKIKGTYSSEYAGKVEPKC